MNYFSLLHLPESFGLDIAALESAYFTAQRECHPDRFVGKSATERQVAMSRSADVNEAYQTLKEPLPRAQYLLSLQNIQVGTEKDSVKPLPAILMEAMELRETPPAKEALEKMIEQSIANIGTHYTKADYDQMAQETLRLGYLTQIPALVAGSGQGVGNE